MGINTQESRLYKVVVTHYLLAAVSFLVLSVLLICSISSFSGHYFQPKLLAVTHVAALGWGTMIIFGALYQLLPVILEKELYSTRLCWLSLFFLLPGTVLLVYGFWVFNPGLYMQIAGILIVAAVISFVGNVVMTMENKKEASVFRAFILTSSLWLLLTVIIGLLLVFNFRYAFLPADHLKFLRLHAHLGIVGWFLLLIIGVSSKLIPMFLVSTYQKTRLLLFSYYLINGSLILFLVDGYLHGIHTRTYFILAAGVYGIVYYLIYIYKCFATRIRQAIDFPMVQSLLSFILLGLALLTLPFILYYHLKADRYAANLSVLYGILIFMGWISTLIMGQTYQTLPYIVWVRHYEKLAGKVPTPLPADLIKHRLMYVQLMSFIIYLLTFIPGFLFHHLWLKQTGSISLMVSALCYFMQLLSLLLHKINTKDDDRI